jgi:hypothetical protein
VARSERGGGLAAPSEERSVVLADAVARERRAVRAQRVQVEGEDAVACEVRRDAAQRREELGFVPEVVERVVEAGDEVERAEHRELAHVAAHELDLGRLDRGFREHRG